MINVLLAETNPVVRVGLISALQESDGFAIAGAAGTMRELTSVAANGPVDVVVGELDFLRAAGRPAMEDFGRSYPAIKLLAHHHAPGLLQAAQFHALGTMGYLSRHCSPSELRIAIATVANGQFYVNPTLAMILSQEIFRPENIAQTWLSPREMRVFKMLAIGIGVNGIAAQLMISARTVDMLKSRIVAKMRQSSFSALTQFALARGFI